MTKPALSAFALAGFALALGLGEADAQALRGPQGQQQAALPSGRDRVNHPVAEFAGLDKITGRIIRFEVRIGETVQFGALQVTPRACVQRLTGASDRTGFIEVDEITLNNQIRRIFGGWMFASSPGLNAVEHPIYDIWLADCRGTDLPTVARGPAAGYQGEGDPTEGAPAAPQQRRPAARPPGTPGGPGGTPAQGQRPPQQRPQTIQPGVPFDPSQLPPRR